MHITAAAAFVYFFPRYFHFKELVLFPTQCHTAVTAVLFFLTKVYNTRTVSCVMLFLLWSTKLSLSPNRAYIFLHPSVSSAWRPSTVVGDEDHTSIPLPPRYFVQKYSVQVCSYIFV